MEKGQQFLKFLGRGSMFNVKEGNTSAYWKDISGRTMIPVVQSLEKLTS